MGETPCSLAASLKIIIVLMQSLMGETPCSLAAPLFRCFPFLLPLGRPMFDPNEKNLPL
ncbi:hypothetical protein [Moorena sp. SIO4G3]|uniref:hypothetical protein n=1 Tax=Moorena sp. SIO4G3 TaxID=2607821 RepID=UPI00142C5C03|nr:hypothetical protein [Moorena sp. SIO4G3]NEO78717.1 hypothetical protein [Moorena sp. SIO4G3]